MSIRVYLAGPDVFFPDPLAWAGRKAAICRAQGLVPVTPFDPVPEPPAWSKLPEADRIARRNEAHIRGCTAVIANLTPFRGVSADAGTVYEVGFARALCIPVFAYSNIREFFEERSGRSVDGLHIERFGLNENLMIDCAVREAGAFFVQHTEDRWTNLTAFMECVNCCALSFRPICGTVSP